MTMMIYQFLTLTRMGQVLDFTGLCFHPGVSHEALEGDPPLAHVIHCDVPFKQALQQLPQSEWKKLSQNVKLGKHHCFIFLLIIALLFVHLYMVFSIHYFD